MIATIFGLDQIVDGVRAYFAHPVRAVLADVLAGEWETVKNLGPPYVAIGIGTFNYVGAAALPPGFRWAPNSWWDLGNGLVAPVVGARVQTYLVWVHSIAPNPAGAPEQNAIEARRATAALSDVTWAALRDIHGFDMAPAPGKALGEERGDFVYGSVLTWGFVVPIPVLGDVFSYAAAQSFSGTTQLQIANVLAVPGDTFGVP